MDLAASLESRFHTTFKSRPSESFLRFHSLHCKAKLDDKTARFLFDISRGICRDEVTPRLKPKSIGGSKTFRGVNAISSNDKETLTKWIGELCNELTERLEEDYQENKRTASTIVVSVGVSQEGPSSSKQCRAPRNVGGYSETATKLALQLIDASKSRCTK